MSNVKAIKKENENKTTMTLHYYNITKSALENPRGKREVEIVKEALENAKDAKIVQNDIVTIGNFKIKFPDKWNNGSAKIEITFSAKDKDIKQEEITILKDESVVEYYDSSKGRTISFGKKDPKSAIRIIKIDNSKVMLIVGRRIYYVEHKDGKINVKDNIRNADPVPITCNRYNIVKKDNKTHVLLWRKYDEERVKTGGPYSSINVIDTTLH